VAIRKTTEKKAPARKPATSRKRAPKVTHDQIAERAYYLHLERGGDPFENWLHAEQELVTA
jgi:hypothetical protein